MEGRKLADRLTAPIASRLLVVVAALALGVGAAACGSDSDGDDGGKQSAASTAPADGTTRSGGDPDGTPDQQIRASYDELVDDMYARKSAAACDRLSPSARERIGNEASCEKALDRYFEAQGSGFIADRPKVVEVTIRGKRALVRAKTTKSNPYSIPFVRLGREWKADGGFETAGL